MRRKSLLLVLAGALGGWLALPMAGVAAQQSPAAAKPNQQQASPAQNNPMSPEPSNAPMTIEQMEPAVLGQIHYIDRFDIEAGRLAQSRSENSRVREFGVRLMMDGEMMDSRVRHLATMTTSPLPQLVPQTPQQQQAFRVIEASMKELHTLRGPAFDRLFLKTVQEQQYGAIALLAAEEKKLPRSGTRRAAKDVIPIQAQDYQIATTLNVRAWAGGLAGGD